jgi:hypothetical protein
LFVLFTIFLKFWEYLNPLFTFFHIHAVSVAPAALQLQCPSTIAPKTLLPIENIHLDRDVI